MQTLDTIEGQPVTWDGTKIRYRGACRVDNDGTGSAHGDPYHQNDTSLHHNGKPLNADIDFYTVIPAHLVKMVAPVVYGCQAYVTFKGNRVACVVGDGGPKKRLGECSNAVCRALGLSDNPISGGSDLQSFDYEILPGVPAVANGVHYVLQRS